MNREIKFRAWDKRMSRMLSDATPMRGSIWWNDGACFDSCGKEYDVMQFTGLYDKNGREVYEGDVVNTPNGNWGVIQYDAPYFGVTVSPTQVSCYTRSWLESCEVVGNIYENPELLSR